MQQCVRPHRIVLCEWRVGAGSIIDAEVVARTVVEEVEDVVEVNERLIIAWL